MLKSKKLTNLLVNQVSKIIMIMIMKSRSLSDAPPAFAASSESLSATRNRSEFVGIYVCIYRNSLQYINIYYIYIDKYIVYNICWILCEFHEAFRKSVAKPNETYKTNLNPSELLIWSHQGAESPEAQTTAPRPWVVLGVPRRCSSRLGCVISESGPCLDDGWIMFWWCLDQGWTMWDLSIWQRNPEHSEICCVKIHPTLSVIRWTSYESMNGKFGRFLKRKVPAYPVQDTHGHRPSEQNEQFVY